MEQWKPTPGYEDTYEVSSFGRLRNLRTGRVLARRRAPNGYVTAHLSVGGVAKNMSVHRLVALAFVPNPSAFSDVDHIDFDVMNNTVGNLRWASHKDNMRRSRAANRFASADVSGAKLDAHIAEAVRKRRAAGEKLRVLSEHYGVSMSAISMIARNVTWKTTKEHSRGC